MYYIYSIVIPGKDAGELTSETDHEMGASTLDMCIDGETLIVPRCSEKSVFYYKLLVPVISGLSLNLLEKIQ